MNDLKNEARDFLARTKEKLNPVVEDAKEKLNPIVEGTKEKAAPVVEDVKEKALEIKEKTAPVIEKAKGAVKEGAEKIGDFFEPKAPGLNIKNELFDELEGQVRDAKDAAKAKAEEMQRRLEEMMGGKKE